MEQNLEIFDSKKKAIQQSLWINFQNRTNKTRFGVIKNLSGQWVVVSKAIAEDLRISFIDIPRDHSEMDYGEIRGIRTDYMPLSHFEELIGAFSVLDGELLRFILHAKIPLEKLIRYELAIRGYDTNNQWVGFEYAKKIWLK